MAEPHGETVLKITEGKHRAKCLKCCHRQPKLQGIRTSIKTRRREEFTAFPSLNDFVAVCFININYSLVEWLDLLMSREAVPNALKAIANCDGILQRGVG